MRIAKAGCVLGNFCSARLCLRTDESTTPGAPNKIPPRLTNPYLYGPTARASAGALAAVKTKRRRSSMDLDPQKATGTPGGAEGPPSTGGGSKRYLKGGGRTRSSQLSETFELRVAADFPVQEQRK